MIAIPRTSRNAPAGLEELRRVAHAVARSEGWTATDAPPGWRPMGAPPEVRLAVSGRPLAAPGVLRVRERRGGEASADVAVREGVESDHVIGVLRSSPPLQARRRTWEAVVLHSADGGGLDRLLARSGGLRCGEAATVLLGVASGVDALHRNGWAAPVLVAGAVVFGADGCPALDGLDALDAVTPEGRVADAEAFHALARTVCLKVTDGSGMLLLGAIESGLRKGTWHDVKDSVLAAVAPTPVRLEAVLNRPDDGDVHAATRTARSPGSRASLIGAVETFLDGDPARSIGHALFGWARRRLAVLIAGALPVLAALALTALLPASPAKSASRADPPTGSPRPAVGSSVATAPGVVVAAPSATAGVSSAETAASTARPAATAPTARQGLDAEDPVIAAAALMEARHACFTAAVPAAQCLSSLLDGDEGFAEAESAALASRGAADVRDFTGASFRLAERWGSAALVSVAPDAARTPKSEPASLLLVRSEAGWRLRAVYP